MRKLELGSGGYPTKGYIHTDIRKLPDIDVVCDLRALPFGDEVFDRVLSKHVIEHFSWRETNNLLGEWVRVLKVGGVFSIQCPNLNYLCHYYSRWFNGETDKPVWFGPEADFFGKQDYPFNYHQTGFSYRTLREKLEAVGIKDIADLTAINGQHDLQYQLHLEGIKSKRG